MHRGEHSSTPPGLLGSSGGFPGAESPGNGRAPTGLEDRGVPGRCCKANWFRRGIGTLASAVAAGCLAGGCATSPDAGLPDVTANSPMPFAPVRLQVHPLSHLDVDPDNIIRLICHVELKDRWGDTTKARGLLRMELYRPGVEVRPDLLTQELSWELDL